MYVKRRYKNYLDVYYYPSPSDYLKTKGKFIINGLKYFPQSDFIAQYWVDFATNLKIVGLIFFMATDAYYFTYAV